MSKLNQMSLREIFNKTNAIFLETDIVNFCDDINVMNKFLELYQNYEENPEPIKEYLFKNEDKLDKEKLVFTLYLNFRENISAIDEKTMEIIKEIERNFSSNSTIRNSIGYNAHSRNIEDFKKYLAKNQKNIMLALHVLNNQDLVDNIQEEMEEIERLEKEREYEVIYLKNCKKFLEDVDVYIANIKVEKDNIEIEILNSQEEIRNKKKSAKKQITRLDKLDSKIGDEGNGLVYILQSLVLSDLSYIIPDFNIGAELREVILNNSLLKQGKISMEEIETVKQENFDKYDELLQSVNKKEYLPELRKQIRANARFIDIDKMLLICLYRFEEYMERNILQKEDYEACRNLAYCIMEEIEDKDTRFHEELETLIDYELIDVNYSYEDAKKYMDRLSEKEYISKQKIEDAKRDIIDKKVDMHTVDISILNSLEFEEEEISQIMHNSTENFAFLIELMNLSEQQILEELLNRKEKIQKDLLAYLVETHKLSEESFVELYYADKINAEFFKEFSEELDISSEVNLQTINELYHQIKNSKEKNEEKQSKLDKQIELYKVLNIEGKAQEEKEEASENIIYEIAEDFDKRNKDITFYFENGLLTLNTVAEWAGDSFIEKLYNESKITFQDLENLYNNKKISQTLIEKAVLENQELEYAELMAYIYLGYVSENKIEELYMFGKIFDSTLEEIALQGKISPQKYLKLTTQRTKEVLEENSKIKLELVNIPTKKEINGITINEDDSNIKDTSYKIPIKKNKTLIDPVARYKFLELLGAKEAKAIIPDEDNTFYNYEFFVIPDSNGELQANSVVIAERIWEDKADQSKGLATENATYFFQYKDLMVNSNLSKKEMSQEKDKIISTANHRIGSWAVSVLYRIAQTTKSSNLKEYKKGDERATVVIDELLKLYTQDELKVILNMAKEIDDDLEHLIEEEIER